MTGAGHQSFTRRLYPSKPIHWSVVALYRLSIRESEVNEASHRSHYRVCGLCLQNGARFHSWLIVVASPNKPINTSQSSTPNIQHTPHLHTHNMAGDPVAGNNTSVISGWTAFGNTAFVKSTLTDLQAMNAATQPGNTDTSVADVADAITRISQTSDSDLSNAPSSDSEPTQEEKDKLLIADPPRLTGEALIDLAERFSTAEIVEYSNGATGGNLTRAAINGRLNAALAKNAKALGTTKFLLKMELTKLRKTRGIRSTRREPDHRHSVVGEDTTRSIYETSGGGQAQVPENNQANEHGQGKSPPQADTPISTHQPKEGGTTKKNSNADIKDSAEDDADLLAQQKADHEAFQDQNSLKGEKILLLAERYSNTDISARICSILGNYPLTENGVATRIHVALEKRAKATGLTTKQVRDDLNAARLVSGAIKATPRGRGMLRSPRGPNVSKYMGFNGLVTKAPVIAQAKRTGAVKQSVRDEEMERPKKRAKKTHDAKPSVATPAVVQVDTEMTDDDSTSGSQDGYDAGEVEAANALLELASGDPEVREAATILVNMHREDAQTYGQPGQIGETAGDMNDSEISVV